MISREGDSHPYPFISKLKFKALGIVLVACGCISLILANKFRTQAENDRFYEQMEDVRSWAKQWQQGGGGLSYREKAVQMQISVGQKSEEVTSLGQTVTELDPYYKLEINLKDDMSSVFPYKSDIPFYQPLSF